MICCVQSDVSMGVPKVRVASIELGNACVDIVLIDHDSESLPYYLTVIMERGAVSFVPVPSIRGTLTAIPQKKKTANPLETERLWRRHFGLGKTPLERLLQLLSEPSK